MAFSATYLPPTGFSFQTLVGIDPDSWLAKPDYTGNAGGAANNIGAGDQIVYNSVTKEDSLTVELSDMGIITMLNADINTPNQTIDWYYLEAQGGYSAGALATLTLENITYLPVISFSPTFDSSSASQIAFGSEIFFFITASSDSSTPRNLYVYNAVYKSVELQLQKALFDFLGSDAQISSAVFGIYDDVPQGSVSFPYITIGEANHAAFNTDSEIGFDVNIAINIWSRHNGRSEVKEIQSYIFNALNRANLVVAGYNLITCDFVNSESFIDQDGKTRHGIQTFRILLDEAY